MSTDLKELKHLVAEIAHLIGRHDDPDPQMYAQFFQHPEYSFQLVDLINLLDEEIISDEPPIYSACIFALDVCVAQLQSATEAKNKMAAKTLTQLMDYLASVINTNQHSLSFWLPILNAFYEVHVDLSGPLKNAYYELANQEDYVLEEGVPISHLDAIKDLIYELSDLSTFEIAENFFAQSYAMPPDFFADLLLDLYSIDEGHDIALLILLHPRAEVREIVVGTMDQIIESIQLSPVSLTRLQTIKHWYPESYQDIFNRWIKIQRKKEVSFLPESSSPTMFIRATEIDGNGSQGLFVHIRSKRKNRLCGLLFKYESGLKDAWITPNVTATEVKDYYHHAFEENVTLREVDLEYFVMMLEHFIDLTLKKGSIPHLQFLEIQEVLCLRLRPKPLDVEHLFEQLSVQITPFTPEILSDALKRSKNWIKTKLFTESWYLENQLVDKIVNHNSSFIDGVKICQLNDAMDEVFVQELEVHRDKWEFHFLWLALWAKVKARKNEKLWKDSFLIAYSINAGRPLKEIPIMKEICYQTVINSVETMRERKTHLSKE